MFHRKNVFSNIKYNIGPWLTFLIISIIVFSISYFIYLKFIYRELAISERKLFGRYIYDYALSMYTGNDQTVSYTMSSFQFNKTMFESTDPSKTWSTDTGVFQSSVGQIQELVVASSIKTSNYFANKKVWEIVHHFVKTVQAKLPTTPESFKYPWGDNWYQFSITYPTFLVITAYLYEQIFNKRSDVLFGALTLYINNYFTEPDTVSGIKSMSWLRDGPNALMMAVPYIGGHLLMKNLKKNNNIMKYVKQFARFEYQTIGEGLYEDGGYIFHSNLRAYGYLYNSYLDIALIAKYFKYNTPERIQKVFSIFEHPDLLVHFGPWFSRTRSIKTSVLRTKYGKIGFFAVDSINAVIAKTKDWMFAFNGQAPHLCYYESDQTNNVLAQIWLGVRVFLDKDSDQQWYDELIPHYPGIISYDDASIILPSDTATTKTFLPDDGFTIICSFGSAIGVRNFYKVNFARYKLTVVELILITKNGHHSYYNIKVDQTLHASYPLTVSMNLGKHTDGDTNIGGYGDMYEFEKNKTFVYPNEGRVYKKTVKHPQTRVDMTCLKIQPYVDAEGNASFGYSTVFQAANEINEYPTSENMISTNDYKLEYDTETKHMYLYEFDNDDTRVAVSKRYPIQYVRDIGIHKKIINDKFGVAFNISDAAIINDEYRTFTKDRYQMILNNVTTY